MQSLHEKKNKLLTLLRLMCKKIVLLGFPIVRLPFCIHKKISPHSVTRSQVRERWRQRKSPNRSATFPLLCSLFHTSDRKLNQKASTLFPSFASSASSQIPVCLLYRDFCVLHTCIVKPEQKLFCNWSVTVKK